MTYTIFTRTWWRHNPSWPGGLEPHPGPRSPLGQASTEEGARDICRVWNANHKPGRLSRKAEYTEATR